MVVALGLLFSVLSSYNLWAGQRWFPVFPLIDGFTIPYVYGYLLMGIEVVLLVLLLIGSGTRTVIFFILALNLLFILLDQNRLQSWFIIYNSFLLVLFFYNWRIDNVNNYNSFFIILQLCFSAVYVFSGIQKINPTFINETYPLFIKSLGAFFSERQMTVLYKTGYVIPVYEILLGFVLLIKHFRFIAIPMVLILHVSIVVLGGVLGSSSNAAVWPWNLAMICFALLLFSGKTTERYFSPSHLFKMPVFYFIMTLFWVLPVFSLFNKQETYLSFSQYSNSNLQSKIILNEHAYANLPLYIRHFVEKERNEYVLLPDEWCLKELNAPVYPERRILEGVKEYVINLTGSSGNDVKLVYIEKQKLFEPHK